MTTAGRFLDLLGSELNRRVLSLTSVRARSAEEVAERSEASLPTVYRHIDDLQAAGLLRASDRYDDRGNHYKVYHNALDEATLRVDDGDLRVAVDHPADVEPAADEEDPRRAGNQPTTGG